MVNEDTEFFLMDDFYQNPEPPQFEGPCCDEKSICLCMEDKDHIEEINEFRVYYLDKNPLPPQFERPGCGEKVISLCMEDKDYIGKIKEFQAYLDMVKSIVKPGCSQEVLKVALSSMSSLVNVLSLMASTPKPHASL